MVLSKVEVATVAQVELSQHLTHLNLSPEIQVVPLFI
jgi:hypothetical protein